MKFLDRNLQHFDPQSIAFDPNNPRGLSEKHIINDPEFNKLTSSIRSYGILVPLIVKPDEEDKSSFVLIDGERRLRAALKAQLKEVPTLIAKNDIDGRILAYQVHMLGVNWNKAAETKAIKRIIDDLQLLNPAITEGEIKKKIIEITTHKEHELEDILILCKHDDKTIEKILTAQLDLSYPIQNEKSFIRPLKKHYPDIVKKYVENNIRKIMIDKAFHGKLVNTRFLMDRFKVVFKDKDNINAVARIIDNFLKEKDKNIAESLNEYELLIGKKKNDQKSGKKVLPKKDKRIEKKESTPKKTSADTFSYKSIKISKKQQTSITDVRTSFEKIGGVLTFEENEYIKEALFCLERNCFKAATLMIWASAISRLLQFISKDLNDFNTASQSMFNNLRSVWKHFAKGFQKNAATIEDIRMTSNDMQLLSYLVYKNIISATQFNKLQSNYKTRCDCAHPTDIVLSPNEITAIFENVYNLIFNNPRLR